MSSAINTTRYSLDAAKHQLATAASFQGIPALKAHLLVLEHEYLEPRV